MFLEKDKYYHFYNRSNNKEIVFKEAKNYIFFLDRYQHYMEGYVSTIAFCLMPTHFHFLIKIANLDIAALKVNIAALLSSYTKAINRSFERHGSLFQTHSKAKEIDDESYLLTLLSYIHQNPLRAGLIKHIEDWPYSSYPTLTGKQNNSFVDQSFIQHYFPTVESFKKYSEELVPVVKYKYWI